jgi:hypothetical protein
MDKGRVREVWRESMRGRTAFKALRAGMDEDMAQQGAAYGAQRKEK